MAEVVLLIIRGLPGSGKSTLAKLLSNSKHPYFEADMYMVNSEGNYKFDVNRLAECHGICQAHVYQTLAEGKSCIVSNTFTTMWEMTPYLEFCKLKEIKVHVVTVEGNYGSIHGVPDDALVRMQDRWEAYVHI